jgi:hypothetical protein
MNQQAYSQHYQHHANQQYRTQQDVNESSATETGNRSKLVQM